MEFVSDGKKYRFDGAYRVPQKGDRFLSNDGHILLCSDDTHYPDVRAIVAPVYDKVVVGGIEWEIVGERLPVKGDWCFNSDVNSLWVSVETLTQPRRIVRPIRIL